MGAGGHGRGREGWGHGQQKGQRQTMHMPAHAGLALPCTRVRQTWGGSICGHLGLLCSSRIGSFQFFYDLNWYPSSVRQRVSSVC